MRNYARYIALALIVIALGVIFLPRIFMSEKKRITKLVEKIETSVEKKKIEDIMLHLSPDYVDSFGHNNQTARGSLGTLFKTGAMISVQIEHLDITVAENKKSATAFIVAKVTAGLFQNKIDITNEYCQGNRFEVDFVKIDGDWKVNRVTNAEYTYD